MSSTVRVAQPVEAGASTPAVTAEPDITVVAGGAPPEAKGSLRAILRTITVNVTQLALFFWVDTFAALFRRRSLATSAGRRAGIILCKLGPGYAKVARLMASHAAVIPVPMLAGFDSCPEPAPRRLPTATVRSVVERAFGPIPTRFAAFGDEPLAVTSLAQVHPATLLDGTAVVVKVVRPGLVDREGEQLYALQQLAWLAGRFLPKGVSFDRDEFVRRLSYAYHGELNLQVEALHLRRTAAALREMPVTGLVVPRPVEGLVTSEVLVTERLDGVPLNQLADREAAADCLGLAVDALLWGAARAGVFHADLRPGNLLALSDGRLGLIDYGDCCVLDADERIALAHLLDATARRDERAQLHALDLMGAINDDVDRRALLARLCLAREDKGDLWTRDPLHDVPHLFLLLADSGIQVPIPILRLAENLLHLEATAAALGAGLELGPHLEATCRIEGARPTDPYGPPLTAIELAGARVDEPERRPPSFKDFKDLLKFVPDALKPKKQNIGNFLPLIVFIPVNVVYGLRWAIAATTGLTLAFTLYQRRSGGQTSKAGFVPVAFIAIPGLFGILLKSQVAVFGPHLLFPLIIGLLFLGSALVGRPVLGLLAQAVWPQPASVRRDRVFARRLVLLTLLLGVSHLIVVLLGFWLLVNSSANTFVAVNTALQQVNGVVFVPVLFILKRTVRRAPEIERRILAAAAVPA